MSIRDSASSWHNYANTVRSNSVVFRPRTEHELIQFVQSNARRQPPMKLKAFGLGHAYAPGPIAREGNETQCQILIDLNHFQCMRLCISPTRDNDCVSVCISPSVQFVHLLEFLESQGLRLPNMTGCLNLTLGGVFSAAGHGSGHQASVAECVEQIQLLQWNGEMITVLQGEPLMQACAGGLGTVGIILSMTLRVESDTAVRESFVIWNTTQHLLCHEQKRHAQGIAGCVSDLDYGFWLPIVDNVVWFTRRKTQEWIKPRRQIIYEAIVGSASPVAVKLLTTLVQNNWMDSYRSFQTVRVALQSTLPLQAHRNTFYRLQKPQSDLVINTHRLYECKYDCEVFIPTRNLRVALLLFSWIFRLVRDRSERTFNAQKLQTRQAILHAKHHLPELFEWRRLQSLIGQTQALAVIPVLIRYCPATDSAYQAPNYQQDVYAFSMSWVGQHQDKCHYERLMEWIIDTSVLYLEGRFHFGKYHHVLQLSRSMLHRYQKAYGTSWQLQRQAIVKEDPLFIFQNDMTRKWFNLY